jgi:hypothetical protein
MANETPVSLAGRIALAAQGVYAGWFGPGQPQTPQAPPDTKTRAFDYPVTRNMTATPRAQTGSIGFHELKMMADGSYLMRVIIEKMKDRLCSKGWHFQLKKETGEIDSARAERSLKDPRIGALTKFFQFPDGQHTWRKWLRMILEQMLVIDAATLEVQRLQSGKIMNLLPVDGSTINVLIDATGRTPQYPAVAYQQVIMGGNVAINFTVRELVYMPRNIRVNKTYGYSPVEQTLILIQTAILRSIYTLHQHDETDVPAGFMQLPEGISTEDASRFMKDMNSVISDDIRQQVKIWPAPHGSVFQPLKREDPFQKFEEWLARIFCYCIGETASPLTQSSNRATAQQNDDTREESGEAPVMQWVVDEINSIIQRPDMFDADDIEFAWDEMVDTDGLKQAQIDQIYVAIGKTTPNELRARDGQPNLTPEQLDELAPPPPPAIAGGFDPQTGEPIDPKNQPPQPGKKEPKRARNDDQTAGTDAAATTAASKAEGSKKKALKVTIDPQKAWDHKATGAIANTLSALFDTQKTVLAEAVANAYGQRVGAATKADDNVSGANGVVNAIPLTYWQSLIPHVEQALAEIGQQTVADVFAQISLQPSSYASMFQIANTDALNYAHERAAELVGMRVQADGSVVANPDAKWSITESTRQALRSEVEAAFEQNQSPGQLAKVIEQSQTFSPSRAQMIARTETAMAQTDASVKVSTAYGATTKSIQLSSNHDHDDECDEARGLGKVPIDTVYPDGSKHVPLHPRCQCVELMHWA